jgi:hypothetical protein
MFVASSCAVRANRADVSRRLDRLGKKYMNISFSEGIPDPLVTFLTSLDALGLLTPTDSSLAKGMREVAAANLEARRAAKRRTTSPSASS